MNFSFKKIASAVALATIAAPSVSMAQGSSVLEEIVVTATKRASTLQDIPIAVSVTTAETIESAQIQDIADLQSVVPTLRVSQNQSSINTSYSIRGFGNGGNNPGIEPSVGVFVDGVYRSRASSSISDFPKLERVEVLSGPQSTLFGKNASAGVISIVSAKPSGESLGQVSASIGNLNNVVLKGYYEGAFSDSAAFSIAGTHNTRDGYNTNLVTGNDVNTRDRQALRGQLLLNPGDNTEIRVIADYDTLDEECCAVVNVRALPVTGTDPSGRPTRTAAIAFAGGQVLANQPFAREYYSNVDPVNEVENVGLSVQIDHDFDAFTLTSISAYRVSDSYYNIDADFTSADLIQNALTDEFKTFTQEFRLASNGGDKVDWMVGGFYFDESVDHRDELPFGAGFRPFVNFLSPTGLGNPNDQTGSLIGLVEQFTGTPFNTFYAEGAGFSHDGTLDNEAISLFGQLDFNITDSLTATVGLNYTKDEKEVTLTQGNRNVFSDVALRPLAMQVFTGLTGLPFTPENLAATGTIGALAGAIGSDAARGLQFTPPIPNLPNGVESNQSDDDDLSYSIRLSYDLNDNINLYAANATGFKASSWNLSRDSRPTVAQAPAVLAALGTPNLIPGTRFAAPEEVELFEIGLKAKFDRTSFNVALFDQTIENFQSNAFTGTGFNLTNAEEQSVKGFEFDITYYPVDSLELKLGGAYLDAVYDEFVGGARNALTGEVFDLSGRDVGGVSDLNLSASANYKFTIGSSDAFLRWDYFYEEDTPIGDFIPEDPVNNTSQFSRETKNLNLTLGMIMDNGLSFTLWGRNVTDHESLTTVFAGVAQDFNFSGYRNQPRTYGVSVSYDF